MDTDSHGYLPQMWLDAEFNSSQGWLAAATFSGGDTGKFMHVSNRLLEGL